jgi:hypothetical protein
MTYTPAPRGTGKENIQHGVKPGPLCLKATGRVGKFYRSLLKQPEIDVKMFSDEHNLGVYVHCWTTKTGRPRFDLYMRAFVDDQPYSYFLGRVLLDAEDKPQFQQLHGRKPGGTAIRFKETGQEAIGLEDQERPS